MQVLPLQLQVVESLREFLRQARTSFDNGHDEHVEKLIIFGVRLFGITNRICIYAYINLVELYNHT